MLGVDKTYMKDIVYCNLSGVERNNKVELEIKTFNLLIMPYVKHALFGQKQGGKMQICGTVAQWISPLTPKFFWPL